MNKFTTTVFILAAVFMLAVITSCTQKDDYKAARDEIMKFHDVVMGDQTKIVNNQLKLDSLLGNMKSLKAKFSEADTTKEKAAIMALMNSLSKAEDSMNDWMHRFEPDVSEKSNKDALQYFKDEKKKIEAIDSVYRQEIKVSDQYLNKFNK